MKNALAILVLTVGLVFAGLPATQAADKKPNILVIWGDDIGVHNISAYNHGIMGYRTPTSTGSPKKGPSSPTPTPNKVARRAVPRSFSVNIRSARGC